MAIASGKEEEKLNIQSFEINETTANFYLFMIFYLQVLSYAKFLKVINLKYIQKQLYSQNRPSLPSWSYGRAFRYLRILEGLGSIEACVYAFPWRVGGFRSHPRHHLLRFIF